MMNYLWGGMILLGVLYGALTGNLDGVTEGVVNSAREGVTLCLSMAGITALWTGVMKIAERAGLVEKLARRFQPALDFLFPELKGETKAKHYISLNFLSNFLGLSWASTSSGLKAMEELGKRNKRNCEKQGGSPSAASNEMCTFLILNTSSLQLIPVSIIAYRSQYGSVNPAAIVGPAILATAVSTGVAVIFCKMMDRKRRV